MEQEKELFRKKSLDRIASPEDLNDYLKVMNVSAWLILVAVIVLLVGLVAWSAFGKLETRVSVEAKAENGVITMVIPDSADGFEIESGMEMAIGTSKGSVEAVRSDEYGRTIATAKMEVPDGTYGAEIVVERVSPLRFLF